MHELAASPQPFSTTSDSTPGCKGTVDDLAIFGGPLAFPNKILHVGRPNLGDKERFLRRIEDVFNRAWLTNRGPNLQELEERLEDFLQVRHCIAVCNATIGLQVALSALRIRGEVLVPAYTFAATVHALQWQGLKPVFCDIEAEEHGLDVRSLESRLTPETTAILAVHLWGRPCQAELIADFARRHKLRLLFDAAHAFGSARAGRMVGGFGDAEVFSFHATKIVNAFEGGAITTNDADLAAQIRLTINFGFSGLDSVVQLGINGKMSEASAAMALTNLDAFEQFVERNIRNHEHYHEGLSQVAGVSLLPLTPESAGDRWNHHYVVAEVDEAQAGISRDALLEILHAENVLARRYFWPGCHRIEPYRSSEAGRVHLPVTDAVAARVLVLPTGTGVDAREITTVCDLIRFAVESSSQIRGRWAHRRQGPFRGTPPPPAPLPSP